MIQPIQTQDQSILYDQDFYLWLETTAQLLKDRRFEEIDRVNLIEEIETMGRSEKKELKSRLIVIIEHLLKLKYWDAAKADNGKGWQGTVIEQRTQLALLLEDSPSLGGMVEAEFEDCYLKARDQALRKCQLPGAIFPLNPPFRPEDILDFDYFPE